ncbi:FK506-binding protein 5 [Hippoglossus stenolepis]|uniref:FK506-binding protein 5 n=1 Tax=Hippoglossus stenolepis TaxID=195615 RepID=UPI001FB0088E|nr:FK506-binding protein 5 [Hippoglossus stenolepis]
MPLKNGNSVALERRMDLASLFCMISRHGPAVALAVIAMVSVLAAFIIYRSVRGKTRRKATAAAGDGDGDSPGAQGDASGASWPEQELSPGDPRSSSVEATDVSDEVSSEMKDDADPFHRDLKLRHRRAPAAENKPPSYSPAENDVQIPEDENTTVAVTVVQDSHGEAETYTEEASHNLRCDTTTVAETEVESATDDGVREEEVLEEVRGNEGCWKEPALIRDERHEEVEKEFEAEDQDDGSVATDDIEDDSCCCICRGKDELEEENHHQDSSDNSNHSSYHLSPEEEKENEGEEAEEEFVEQQLVPQQDEICPSTCEQVTPQVLESDLDNDGQPGEGTEEDTREDHVLEADEFDTRPPQSDKEQQIDQTNGLTDNQEDAALPTEADEAEEETTTSDDTVVCGEEHDGSSVVLGSSLHPLDEPVQVDDHDDEDLSGANTDPETRISGVVDSLESSSDCQQPQSEENKDEISKRLDKDTDLTDPGSDAPSLQKELHHKINQTSADDTLAEESVDLHLPSQDKDQQTGRLFNSEAVEDTSVTAAPDTVTCEPENILLAETISHPHVLSCDEHFTQTKGNEAFDECSDAADPDSTEAIAASVKGEEMSCPHFSSVCQHQTSDHMEVNETLVEATDAAVCDNDTITTSVMSEEISPPDTLALPQDQESDQMQTKGTSQDLDRLMWKPPLPSFERSELRDQDEGSRSSPGVEAESGISSMAVSPDLQDAGHDFGETVEDMVVPQLDCDPQSEEGTEAKNNLYADDAAVAAIKDDTVGMVFGPYPSRLSQQPHSEAKFDLFADNEDTFGHEIEDSYHRALEQLMLQIPANVMSTTDEQRNQTDEKAVVEVVKIHKKKEDVRTAKKMETETEKEDDYEKTEISIMEATMDNNEWITDSNQVLPWMNITVPSFSQDHKNTDQPPTDDLRPSSSLTDVSCVDTELAPSTEDRQTRALSAVDENTENNKKVVAVHPMPQYVNVTFSIHYLTRLPYQTVAITGNQQELGNWKDFVPLERAKDGHWATVVSLPAESHVEWKFVLVEKGEVCRWEESGNRLLDTGSGDELTVHKWWGLL